MEVLNNFSSIHCFITFILGAMFMFITLCIAAMCKTQEPKNKIHFYVARDKDGKLWLYIGEPIRGYNTFVSALNIDLTHYNFHSLGLNKNDYDSLKWEDEPVEVFLNMEE